MENGSDMPAALKILEEAGIPARRMDYDYAEGGLTRSSGSASTNMQWSRAWCSTMGRKERKDVRSWFSCMGMKGFLCASLSGFPELAVLPRRLLMWRGN